MALIGPPPPRGGRRTIGHARSAADQHRLLPWRSADQAALAGHADRGSATVDAELVVQVHQVGLDGRLGNEQALGDLAVGGDRKSTRLNSSHVAISYAV